METERPPKGAASLVGVLATAYVLALGVEPQIHMDTARDMLLARDGLATGFYLGCNSAFGGFVQGALWERYLAATFALGIGPLGQYRLLLAALVLSVVAFHRLTSVNFGRATAHPATLGYLSLSVVAMGYPNLWNPALGPVGATLWWYSLLRITRTGGTASALGIGFGLALAVEAHMASVLFAPIGFAVVWGAAKSPVRATLAALAAAVGSSLAFSLESWKTNWGALAQVVWYLPFLLVAAALAIGVATRGRRAFHALAVSERTRAVVRLLLGLFGLEILAASLLHGRPLVSPQYAIAAVPALSTLLGIGFAGARAGLPGRARRRVVGAILGILVCFPLALATAWRVGVVGGAAGTPVYTMSDAKTLASYFWSRGYTFPDVQRHLRGPDSLELIASIAPYARSPRATPDRVMPDLRILAFDSRHAPNMALAAGAERVRIGRGRSAWVLPITPWVDIAPSRFCSVPRVSGARATCAEVRHSSIRYGNAYRMLAYPTFESTQRILENSMHARSGTTRLRWELPITLRGDDAERHVELAGVFAGAWRIERVDAVGHRGTLPARHVVLDRTGASHGVLVLSVDGGVRRAFVPDFLETSAGEGELRRAARRLSPLGRQVCRTTGSCPPAR